MGEMKMRLIKILALVVWVFIIAIACGDNGGNSDENGSSESGDFVKLSINSGVENTFTEAFSADIVCDPRVDWASSQVILYDNYIGSGNWDILFDIMFGISDAVGNYDITISGDGLQVVFINGGVNYTANSITAGSSGTVNVTRSDTRIEGTFTITAVDAGSNPITLSGSFGVDSGNSLSCP
jgi:hypothetical protein